jgi:hypothetical protein
MKGAEGIISLTQACYFNLAEVIFIRLLAETSARFDENR